MIPLSLMAVAAGVVPVHARSEQSLCREAPDIETARRHCTLAVGLGELTQREVARVFEARGYDFMRTKDYGRALENYSEAITQGANRAGVFMTRGGLYTRMKEYDKAFQDFDRAVRLDPNMAEAWI